MTDRPARPHWEYPGTFNKAWDGVDFALSCWDEYPEQRGQVKRSNLEGMLDGLAAAHVVTIDPVQYQALPLDVESLMDFRPDPNLPFPILYVSIGDELLSGFMVTSTNDRHVAVFPFWDCSRVSIPVQALDATSGHYRDLIHLYIGLEKVKKIGIPDRFDDPELMITVERSLSVLRFMESANVDIEDQEVSRQVRRQVARKGWKISQRVYVRSPKHRARRDGTTEHIEFSHRFEVAGHYKHYGPDTRLFKATERDRPEKIIQHPTRGPLVRIWCPNFVKGPDEKPLVIKTRVRKEVS